MLKLYLLLSLRKYDGIFSNLLFLLQAQLLTHLLKYSTHGNSTWIEYHSAGAAIYTHETSGIWSCVFTQTVL